MCILIVPLSMAIIVTTTVELLYVVCPYLQYHTTPCTVDHCQNASAPYPPYRTPPAQICGASLYNEPINYFVPQNADTGHPLTLIIRTATDEHSPTTAVQYTFFIGYKSISKDRLMKCCKIFPITCNEKDLTG